MRYLVATLLLFLLSSCLPQEEGGLSLHDVSLYDIKTSENTSTATLYGYFYGDPTQIDAGGTALNLTQGRADAPLAVPSALLVNNEPYLSQPVAPLTVKPLEVQRTPFSTDLILRTGEDLGAVAYYDGDLWFTLTDDANAGEERRVVPRERVGGLFGLGELTRDEARAFERLLTGRAPVVVAALPEMRVPERRVGGLSEYRSTALVVQEGLEEGTQEGSTDMGTDQGADSADAVAWEGLARGNQATGGESPRFFVANSQAELEDVWGQAYGSLRPQPEVPQVDFSQESVAGMFLGQKPTGGYGVSVQDVTLEDGEVYLQVNVTEPAPDAITTQAFTNPWVMVRIERPDLSNAWFREVGSQELLGVAREGK